MNPNFYSGQQGGNFNQQNMGQRQGQGQYQGHPTFNNNHNNNNPQKQFQKNQMSQSDIYNLFQQEISEITSSQHEEQKQQQNFAPQQHQQQQNVISQPAKLKGSRWNKPINVQQPQINAPPQQQFNQQFQQNQQQNFPPQQQNQYQQPQKFNYNFHQNQRNNMPQQQNFGNNNPQMNTFGQQQQQQSGGRYFGQNQQMQNEQQQPQNPPPQAQKQPSQQKQKENDSIDNYVKRAFERCKDKKDQQAVEKAIKKIFNQAIMKGEYNTRNWDVFPLPTLPSEQKPVQSSTFSMENASTMNSRNNESEKQSILANIDASRGQKGSYLDKRTLNSKNFGETKVEGFNEKGKKILKTAKGNNHNALREDNEKKKQRFGRFEEDWQRKNKRDNRQDNERQIKLSDIEVNEDGDVDMEALAEKWKVVGTNQNLEKPYLRLTSEPDPSTVRPEPILKKALKLLLKKWKDKEASYAYIAEQFRSMRQDLNVQHIKNKFTVKVYENNARISLESHDINYFNQCQSRLKEFYRLGLKSKNKCEFLSYRIIYLTLCEMYGDLNSLLRELSEEEYLHDDIQFSLDFRRHYENGNIKQVFNMYKNGIGLTPYLIDIFLNRLRVMALKTLTKSHGDKLSVQYLTDLLAFNEVDDFRDFVKSSEGVLSEDQDYLMNKDSFKVYNDHPWMRLKLKTHKVM